MKLIVGLGNPGKKFKKTRHNLGFEILDKFKRKNRFPNFKLKKNSLVSKNILFGEKIILAKPQTFMNNSGKAVKELMKDYQIKKEDLILIHDDLDIPIGKFKISFGKSSAGHKGVQSVIDKIKTKDFLRFRVGIKPISKVNNRDFVIKKFQKKEEEIITETIKVVIESIEILLKKGLQAARERINHLPHFRVVD